MDHPTALLNAILAPQFAAGLCAIRLSLNVSPGITTDAVLRELAFAEKAIANGQTRPLTAPLLVQGAAHDLSFSTPS